MPPRVVDARRPSSRLQDNWFIWIGGVIVPFLILVVLAVVTVDTTSALRTLVAGRGADRRGREIVVVGGALPGPRRRHRQRDPHPARHADQPAPHLRQRDPQLLGAPARGEDGHDPGPAQQPRVHRRQGRPVPGSVRRVLRAATRTHGRGGGRRDAGRLRTLAGPSRAGPARAGVGGGGPRGAGRSSAKRVRGVTPSGAPMRRARSAPTSPTSARAGCSARAPSRTRPRTCGPGSATPRRSSPASRCPRSSRCPTVMSPTLAAYLESLK